MLPPFMSRGSMKLSYRTLGSGMLAPGGPSLFWANAAPLETRAAATMRDTFFVDVDSFFDK